MAYNYTHPGILDTINSWIYMSLIWFNHIPGGVLCTQIFLNELVSQNWEISLIINFYIHSLISKYILHIWRSLSHMSRIRKFLFYSIIINLYQISTFWTKIQAYYLKLYLTPYFHILIMIIFYMFLGMYLDYIYIFLFCDDFPLTLKKWMCWNPL